jgi:hypothetical protein
MHQTIGGRTWATVRTGMVSVVAAWALSGCGGGAKETNTDIPEPAPTGGVAAAAQTQALLIGYQPAPVNTSADNMLAVDPGTGKVAWSQSTDNLQGHAFTYEHVIDSYGVAQQRQSVRQLIYIYDHRIYGLPLTPQPNVKAHQISSATDACSIEQVFESDPSGQDAWLIVTTKGADDACHNINSPAPSDDQTMLIHTSWGDAQAAAAHPFSSTLPTLAITDKNGLVIGIVGYHDETGQLAVLKQDSNGAVAGAAVANGQFSSLSGYRILGRVPGSATKAYVLVGSAIRVLDWGNNIVKLDTSVVTQLHGPNYAHTLQDQQYLYIVDGSSLKRLGSNGLGGNWPDLPGAPTTVLQTPDYSVVDQPPSNGSVSWYAISKITGVPKFIYTANIGEGPPMLASPGNVLLSHTPVNGDHLTVSITRHDLDNNTHALVDGEARVVFPVTTSPVALDPNSRAVSHLLLCHVDDTTGACQPKNAVIYDVQAKSTRPLAPISMSSNEPAWTGFDFGFGNTRDFTTPVGPRYLLRTFAGTGSSTTSKLWMFDPNVEGSLTLVP